MAMIESESTRRQRLFNEASDELRAAQDSLRALTQTLVSASLDAGESEPIAVAARSAGRLWSATQVLVSQCGQLRAQLAMVPR